MEDLAYHSELALPLEVVEETARACGYQTSSTTVADIVFLNISPVSAPGSAQWQWVKAGKETLNNFTQADPERMVKHSSGTGYIVDFMPSTLPELARFLKLLLQKYGGWVGVEDEFEFLYTAENIETIVEHPLFASVPKE